MSKFKVGDCVVVKYNAERIKPINILTFVSGMRSYYGKVSYVKEITIAGNYKLEGFNYFWDENWLEPCKDLSVTENDIDSLLR